MLLKARVNSWDVGFAAFYISLGAKLERFTRIAEFVIKLYIKHFIIAALQMSWPKRY